MGRLSAWTVLALVLLATAAAVQDVRADTPSENECRPYIEKALHELKAESVEGVAEVVSDEDDNASTEDTDDINSKETDTETADSEPEEDGDQADSTEDADASAQAVDNVSENADTDDDNDSQADDDDAQSEETDKSTADEEEELSREKRSAETEQDDGDSGEDAANEDADAEDDDNDSKTDDNDTDDSNEVDADAESVEKDDDDVDSGEAETDKNDDDDDKTSGETDDDTDDSAEKNDADADSKEDTAENVTEEDKDDQTDDGDSTEEQADADDDDDNKSGEQDVEDDADSNEADTKSDEADKAKSGEDDGDDSAEKTSGEKTDTTSTEDDTDDDAVESREKRDTSGEDEAEDDDDDDSATKDDDDDDSKQEDSEDSKEDEIADKDNDSTEETSEVTKPVQSFPEDDLLIEYVVPTNLRDHSHVNEILRLDTEFDEKEAVINKVADSVLKDLKKIYENAIKPLETLYKYRDLSNRHFGDPEILSKPLVLFMGPWSGGKSTILNYLTENEHTADSLRTGAEPSPAYFNILMHGDKPEVLDGTQLAADWTFSGLQKFGQGLEDRLRGQKLPHKLLEKVNIVEIPGILEVRKQVSRLFPFNDACQWFIDRADIIFLVYDPSKLDVGPETEAILDQLKGREYQTRILLNKADQVKPEELLRVQGALIWNISPLMSSAQPPVMYTTSLWSHPYEEGAPVRLLQAQEHALLRDLRTAIDKRIDNKIASARRFAVRVRNHAKMVDCYLTTYYNHKTLFGNKNQIATNIIENPQNYHIYEGLSTLTNISRYDLPDPDVYRDFFRLNKLYDFQKLSETCTYFRGCPINKLDVAIAYDLPELVGKYKKAAEAALISIEKKAEAGKS